MGAKLSTLDTLVTNIGDPDHSTLAKKGTEKRAFSRWAKNSHTQAMPRRAIVKASTKDVDLKVMCNLPPARAKMLLQTGKETCRKSSAVESREIHANQCCTGGVQAKRAKYEA